jgi:hypothetical protein
MSSERLRPNQAGPLTEFTFAIIGAFVVGVRRRVRLLRATQRIGTPWGPVWGPTAELLKFCELNQIDN